MASIHREIVIDAPAESRASTPWRRRWRR